MIWDGSSNYDKHPALFQKGLEAAYNNGSRGHNTGSTLEGQSPPESGEDLCTARPLLGGRTWWDPRAWP